MKNKFLSIFFFLVIFFSLVSFIYSYDFDDENDDDGSYEDYKEIFLSQIKQKLFNTDFPQNYDNFIKNIHTTVSVKMDIIQSQEISEYIALNEFPQGIERLLKSASSLSQGNGYYDVNQRSSLSTEVYEEIIGSILPL